MPGLVPGIHAFRQSKQRRGWPGQARPWRTRDSRPGRKQSEGGPGGPPS